MPARAINSPLLERLDAGETFTARKCNGCLTACKKDDSIPYCISRALIAAVKGDWDNGLFFAGSNADRVDRIMSVQELFNEIMTDYRLNKSDIKKKTWRAGNMLYPVPAVMVSCARKGEKPNIITVAWAGTVCSDPAMVSISVRKERYSHDIIKETGEFVINLTTKELAFATDYCGVKSGRDVD